MKVPCISIIVPIYNTEHYLEKCLSCLQKQSLKDIEVILVNDGSSDNSAVILKRYAAEFPSLFFYYEKANGGLSSARNYGIERACGEYLSFVDSDDYIDVMFCELMYNKAVEEDADIVCCGINFCYKDGAEKREADPRVFGSDIRDSPSILIHAGSYACNKIFRRSFWNLYGYLFPDQWFEDSALIYNIMLDANRVSCVDNQLYNYIKERDNAITRSVNRHVFDIFLSMQKMIDYYRDRNAFFEFMSELEYICIRHLLARINIIRYGGNIEIACQYINRYFVFLDRWFPEWRKSRVFKKKEFKAQVKSCVFRCRFLFYLYMYIPVKK